MNMKQRLGRFHVSRHLIEQCIQGSDDNLAAWNSVFGQLIVIEAVHRWDCGGRIEYLAHCRQFDELPEGAEAPVYQVEISRHEEMMGAQNVTTFRAKFTK